MSLWGPFLRHCVRVIWQRRRAIGNTVSDLAVGDLILRSSAAETTRYHSTNWPVMWVKYLILILIFFCRAIRTDRVVQASTEFINRVLGRKFLRDDPPDLGAAMKQSSSETPIVLFFSNGKSTTDLENSEKFKLF